MNFATTTVGLAMLCASLWLGGCGYRLAGTDSLPESRAEFRLVTQNFSVAGDSALRSRLKQAGAKLVVDPAASVAELEVSWLAPADIGLVSSASNGKTVQRISRGIRFSLRDAAGQELITNQTLTQQTDILLDDDNLLASDQERAEIAVDLQRVLFNQLIRQLNRI